MSPDTMILFGTVGGGVFIIVLAVGWWVFNRADAPTHHDDPLPLFMTDGPVSIGTTANNGRATVPSAPAPAKRPFSPPPPTAPDAAPKVPPEKPRPAIREFVTGASTRPAVRSAMSAMAAPPDAAPGTVSAPASPALVVNEAGVPGTMVEGPSLRFSVPEDGTLRFLPGRLEVVAGRDQGREIRFVDTGGADGCQVSFGRAEGPLYRHVQLREQTVSRRHAILKFHDGRWHLCSLSQTNPVVLNGAEQTHKQEAPLTDGDRLEFGEVIFTFHAQ